MKLSYLRNYHKELYSLSRLNNSVNFLTGDTEAVVLYSQRLLCLYAMWGQQFNAKRCCWCVFSRKPWNVSFPPFGEFQYFKQSISLFYCKEVLIICVACSVKPSSISVLSASCLELTFSPMDFQQAIQTWTIVSYRNVAYRNLYIQDIIRTSKSWRTGMAVFWVISLLYNYLSISQSKRVNHSL